MTQYSSSSYYAQIFFYMATLQSIPLDLIFLFATDATNVYFSDNVFTYLSVYSYRQLAISSLQLLSMNKDLLIKYEKDAHFQKQIDTKLQRYKSLQQAGTYCDLSAIPQNIIKKIPNHNLYIYFGCKQPTSQKLLQKIAIFLVKNFKPDTEQSYRLIFLNEFCPDNYVLWNFREILANLTLQQIAALQQMIVVKPFFYHKAMDWMTFGTIPKYLKSKTVFVNNLTQLCNRIDIPYETITDEVPSVYYQKQFPEIFLKTLPVQTFRQNVSGQQRCEQQMIQMQEFQKTIQSMVMKPGNEINTIQDYQMSQIGVPIILKMLVFFFETRPSALEVQGLFRKSVSIDEQTETLNQIMKNNYDYLLQIQNPHIIANLIKRFFSSLKIPIFPFEQHDYLMKDVKQKTKQEHLKDTIDQLPDLNKRVLLFLANFLGDMVIANEKHNKMSAQNIGICFGPCIFRAKEITQAQILNSAKAPVYMKLLISQRQTFFGNEQQQSQLYRQSYIDKQKNFSESLDIGLQETMKGLDMLQKQRTSRCSMKVKDNNKQQEILNILGIPSHNSQKVEQQQGQIKINVKNEIESEAQKQNPINSQNVGENEADNKNNEEKQEKYQSGGIVSITSSNQDQEQRIESKQNDFLNIVSDQNKNAYNPRFSKNMDASNDFDNLMLETEEKEQKIEQ